MRCFCLTVISGKTRKKLFDNIKAGVFDFSPEFAWNNVSDEAKDFVSRLIVVDPDLRYDYDQIIAHEWITSDKRDHSDLTANLKSLERFNLKKRDIGANMQAHAAALIMEDLMGPAGFGFGFGEEEEEADEERPRESRKNTLLRKMFRKDSQISRMSAAE